MTHTNISPLSVKTLFRSLGLVTAASLMACSDEPTGSSNVSKAFVVLGRGAVTDRYTSELNVRGNFAYTSSWGIRVTPTRGNAVKIWNIASTTPILVDSLVISGATTTGDVQVSDDGQLLVVAIEGAGSGNGIAIYRLTDPAHPTFVTRYTSANTAPGVHTAEVARVNGVQYGFLSIDPSSSTNTPAKLVVVNLTDPPAPTEVLVRTLGSPYVHDVFVRDGILFTAEWNDGVGLWDIGGGGKGGTVASPVRISTATTVNGAVHNMWWYKDASGTKKYLFVGEEGPGNIGASSIGDVHVVDVSNIAVPKEVAVYNVPGAGTHNFSMDETRGVLYAAYYNGGVRAIDVHGDLGSCSAAQKRTDGRCDLGLMGREVGHLEVAATMPMYVWGVQYLNGVVYASDMLNGLWKLEAITP